ncbi:hypothetical protein WP12_01965 [Sphingomonas sp. SRS2]|nr:hypothetical protein WP12_01965 [Sphingomonas sp. SRS2]
MTAIFAPFPEFTIKRKENNFDWNVSGQYYLDRRNVLYASASRGNKSGGFQTLPSNPALTEFEGERALTLETGVKSQLFGRVGLDVALFSTTVKDFQYVINTPQGNAVTNVKVRSRGVDAAVNWRPTRELRIDGGVVYADTRILEAFAGAPAGSRPSRAPVWSGNASIMYKVGLSENLDLTVNPYVDFSSSQYNQLPSANAPKRQSYALVNARVAIGESNGNWELALIGKNLTNQQIFYTSTTPLLAGGPWYGNISTPATFALQITVKR